MKSSLSFWIFGVSETFSHLFCLFLINPLSLFLSSLNFPQILLFICFQIFTAFIFLICSLFQLLNHFLFCLSFTFTILLPSFEFYFLLQAVLVTFSCLFLFSVFLSISPLSNSITAVVSVHLPLIVMSPTF